MRTPRIEINLGKIIHNAQVLKRLYGSKDIDIIGVTKGVCGNPIIANALVKSGIKILADSRISNIKKMHNAGVKAQFLLLRTPLLSQVEEVVQHTDISLNSEPIVIEELSKFAIASNVIHQIILMVELGDLREGILPTDIDNIIEEIIRLKGVKIIGIGTNLACFGGIKPDEKNMNYLSSIADNIEEKFKLQLKFVSGGNSANYCWFISSKKIHRINNLRLGESIFLGRETLHREPIPELFTDAFTLIAEVIESKTKHSIPYGEIAQNTSGSTPEFQDQGLIKRAILGIGLQDVVASGLTSLLDIEILGASSDHLMINSKQTDLKVGMEIGFNLNYAALLSAMTSPYVNKSIQ